MLVLMVPMLIANIGFIALQQRNKNKQKQVPKRGVFTFIFTLTLARFDSYQQCDEA